MAAFDGVLYRQAAASLGWPVDTTERIERFFDGQAFDALHTAGA